MPGAPPAGKAQGGQRGTDATDCDCRIIVPFGWFLSKRTTQTNNWENVMRKAVLVVIVLLIAALLVWYFTRVQGSGIAKTETREVHGVSAISFTGVGRVVVEQGTTESLTVTADDNILPLLETQVNDGTLVIGVKSNNIFNTGFNPRTPIEFKVVVKELTRIALIGAGDANVRKLKTDKLDVSITGVGNLTISGSTDHLNVTLSGTGTFQGEDFAAKSANVTCSGTGNAVVKVSEKLDANVSGVGSIEYIGNPQVTEKVSGIGQVKKR
jgi:hypothetical protein